MIRTFSIIILMIGTVIAAAAPGYPYGIRTVPSLLAGTGNPSLFFGEDPAGSGKFSAAVRGSVSFLLERASGFSAPVSEYNNSWSPALDALELRWKPARYISLGAGSSSFRSFAYSARRETETEIKTYSASGEIRSWHLSVFAVRPGIFFAGSVVRLLAGSSEVRSGFDSLTDPLLDDSSKETSEYLGIRPEILAGVHIPRLFSLTAFFAPPGRIVRDKTTVWALPIEAGLGLYAKAGSGAGFEAEFFGEALYANGRRFTEKNGSAAAFTPSVFRDTLSILAGCSFAAGRRKDIFLRAGWFWLPMETDRYSDRQAVFFGGKIPFARNFSATFDADWSLRPYRGDGVFFDADSSVQQNIFSVSAGVSYAVK